MMINRKIQSIYFDLDYYILEQYIDLVARRLPIDSKAPLTWGRPSDSAPEAQRIKPSKTDD